MSDVAYSRLYISNDGRPLIDQQALRLYLLMTTKSVTLPSYVNDNRIDLIGASTHVRKAVLELSFPETLILFGRLRDCRKSLFGRLGRSGWTTCCLKEAIVSFDKLPAASGTVHTPAPFYALTISIPIEHDRR